MSVNQREVLKQPVVYPDRDGQPIADNTLQFHWIMTIVGGLQALFADDPNVFVAGDLLWYPVEGDNRTRVAPDALVVFGRPKGYRGSYRQWEEDGIAPQVVFEVLSPGNTRAEMAKKLAFYQRFGVDEYYLYDPDNGRLQGWQRHADELQPIAPMRGWVSPRLGVRFDLADDDIELCLYDPQGELFVGYVDVKQQQQMFKQRAETAEQRAENAEQRIIQAEQQLEQEAAARKAAEAELARLRALLESNKD